MAHRDEIIEEVRAAREALFARFDYDLDKLYAHLKEREKAHPERMSKLKPLEPRKKNPAA